MNHWKTMMMGGATAALLVLAAGAAAAQNAPTLAADDSCRAECSDGLRECRRAAVHAYRFCHGNCREAIQAAVQSARQTCRDENLTERQCALLVKRASAGAAKGCRKECKVAFRRARAVCLAGKQECHDACDPNLDPACVDQCRGDFAACRDEVGLCRDTCTRDLRADIQACRDSLGDVCDPLAFRECVTAAKRSADGCLMSCGEQYQCPADMRDCLGQCADPTLP